ncbi:MAG: dihydrolipoyl dehydrogenase [Clostridia bacterium]|nr:dihydrolipoyl dehydrogenase [Clostridia bacterium]
MHDLIIIGGGPAGYHAAELAAKEGLKAVLFEERSLGGVCLNEGCIPSKALLYSAKIFDYANGGGARYGVTCEAAKFDYAAAVRRKAKVVKKLVAGIEATLKREGVEVVKARAEIEGRIEDQIKGGFAVRAGGQDYRAAKLLLCTGSEPLLPPIGGLKDALASGFAMTNREMLALTEPPKRLAIVGGGVIGMEMASLMTSALCEVTVIEMLDKIAGPTDAEIAALLQKEYEKRGVRFLLGAKLTGVDQGSVTYEQGGKAEVLPCDRALISIGRRPVTAGIGLERIGVEVRQGAVPTDAQQKTNVPGVFAAGDINGTSMLAHTAYREAEVAVNVMCGRKDAMEYDAIPSVIYTNPEAAGVGETLQTARAKGIDAREVTLPMMYSGRYMAENEGGGGICKLVWAGERRLIGVHMLGNPASEIIATAAALISREISLEQAKKIVFPHPSVAEILREGLFHS